MPVTFQVIEHHIFQEVLYLGVMLDYPLIYLQALPEYLASLPVGPFSPPDFPLNAYDNAGVGNGEKGIQVVGAEATDARQ